jgi:dihydroxyacetone kinase-like predicted kinase
VKEISGKQLYYAFAAGGQAVISQREDLNKMNVYPVPDGDTGSNLSFTLKNIIEQSDIFQDAGKTMQSLAEAALSGARGNSGSCSPNL